MQKKVLAAARLDLMTLEFRVRGAPSRPQRFDNVEGAIEKIDYALIIKLEGMI